MAGGGGPDGLKQFKGNCQLQSVVDDAAAAAKVPNDFHDKNNSSSCSPKKPEFRFSLSPFRQTARTYDLVCLNTVDRVVATDSRDPWFESKFYCLNWPLFKEAIGGSKNVPKTFKSL